MSAARRWRVNHWSPWGADASGIANYARHLVPELDDHVDVTIVHPSEVDSFYRTLRPDEVDAPTLDDADLNIFHVGNHLSFHHWMLAPLMRFGGVVVLHDWSLFDLIRPLFYRSVALWQREMRFNHEHDIDLAQLRNEPGFLMAHPMNRRVLEAADVVVAHTPWTVEMALAAHPHLDVRYVPLAGPSLEVAPVPANGAITVLGGVGRHKQIDVAVRAFARVAPQHPDSVLRIVGRGDDRAEIARLRELSSELRVDRRVEWHLDVDRARYLELIEASLLVVTLRGDTAGEMSGVMVEAWGAGRVAVTSDQPQFRSFDERICRRIPIEADAATDALAAILAGALANPAKFDEDGQLARASSATFAEVAVKYGAIVDELASRPGRDVTHGLNIFGSWGTPSGLVEGARRLVGALLDAHVPLSLPWSFRLPSYENSLVPARFARVPHERTFAANLWTANINEFHVIDQAMLGTPESPRWNIATWIYEFSEIPEVLIERFALVNEIWAGSDFSADVFRRHFDGTIMTLPYVVEPRPATMEPAAARARFGLREESTVVLFTFDFGSGWARKNPLAVVAAFRDAVALSGEDAQLVIKVSGLTAEHGRILTDALAGLDATLLNEHLSDAELGDLFHSCDVYCSLHRAEGFGLGLAEAMSIGKCAVATAYSGNLDFMNETNSLLVPWAKSHMTHADAAANPGLSRIAKVGAAWAEPDHDAAVAALVRSFEPELRRELGERARADIARRHSAPAVARVVAARIDELGESLRGRRTAWPSRSGLGVPAHL
jgi:glycosyltransferase involved in cell wall biosynthesis